MECNHCEKEIKKGDSYIKEESGDRYCSECFSTDITTIYYVGGDYVGSDNEIEEYDSSEIEED